MPTWSSCRWLMCWTWVFLLEKSRPTFVGKLLKETGNSKKKLDKWKRGTKTKGISFLERFQCICWALQWLRIYSSPTSQKQNMWWITVKESWCLELRKSLNTMPGAWPHMYGFLPPQKKRVVETYCWFQEILHQLIGSQGYSGAGFLPSTVGSLKLTVCRWKLVANDPFLWVLAHFLRLWLLVLGRVEVQSCLISDMEKAS